jgi:hypothetical protein
MNNEKGRELAQKRLKGKSDFYPFLLVWLGVSLLVTVVWFISETYDEKRAEVDASARMCSNRELVSSGRIRVQPPRFTSSWGAMHSDSSPAQWRYDIALRNRRGPDGSGALNGTYVTRGT